MPRLIDSLNDRDAAVRVDAARALAKVGSPAASAVATLMEKLTDDGNGALSSSSAAALAKIGVEAVPVLISALDHPKARVRCLAAHSLGDIGVAARAAVPKLADGLHDESAEVRLAAALALGESRSEAPSLPGAWADLQ